MPKPLQVEEPSRKHKKFIQNVAKGQNLTRAATNAGFMSPGYGSYLMRQPIIRDGLARVMEKAGATDENVANVLGEGLGAIMVKKDGGKEYVDYETRRRYAELILKTKKDIDSVGSNVSNTQINIVVTPELAKGLVDSGAVTIEEIEELQHEPIREENAEREKQ